MLRMTFVPTPHDQLPPLAEVFAAHQGFDQALLSYVYYQEQAITDLYSRLLPDNEWPVLPPNLLG
jgi:hypothetical protein